MVAAPADRPVAAAALARGRRGASRPVPGGVGGARPRAAEPLAREDRLLPAADLPRRVAGDRPLPRLRAVEAGRPRVGPPRPAARGGGPRPRPRPAAADPRRVAARGRAAAAPGGRGRGRRGLSARRGGAPDAAPRRGRARLAGRRGLARPRRLLPPGLRRRPAQPRDRGRRGAREVVPARPADGLLLRPDPREARRAAARPPGGVLRVRPVEPGRLPRAVPAPGDPGAGRVLPRGPPLPRDRPLPLRAGERAHARGPLLDPRAGRGRPRRELHDEPTPRRSARGSARTARRIGRGLRRGRGACARTEAP